MGMASSFFWKENMGVRYSKVDKKFKREIVLLKSFPCVYGKCAFCNYIEDNSINEAEMNRINFEGFGRN